MRLWGSIWVLLLLLAVACGDDGDGDTGADADSDTDTDTDSDGDTDSDSDGDTDADTGTGTEAEQDTGTDSNADTGTGANMDTACDAYWSGDNCDVCEGFNGGDAENCQCPDSTFLPQAGSSHCWSCPIPQVTVSGVCDTAGYIRPWNLWGGSCPTGFHMPQVEELLGALYDSWDFVDNTHYETASCATDPVCNTVYPSTGYVPGVVWTATSCGTGVHWVFDITNGTGGCMADTNTFQMICLSN